MAGAPPQIQATFEQAYAALDAGDIDSFLEHIDENVEFTSIVAEAEGTTFHGHDGVREWWASVRGAFEVVVGLGP